MDLYVGSQFEDRSVRVRRTKRTGGRGILQTEGSAVGMRVRMRMVMLVVLGRIWPSCVIAFRPGSGVGPLLSRLLEPGRRRSIVVVRPRSAVLLPHVGMMIRSGCGIARSAASSVLSPVMVVHYLLRPVASEQAEDRRKCHRAADQFYCYFSLARSDPRPNENDQARMQVPAHRWSPLAAWWIRRRGRGPWDPGRSPLSTLDFGLHAREEGIQKSAKFQRQQPGHGRPVSNED